MRKRVNGYALMNRGVFIAAFRFRPKRVYIPGDATYGERGYYAWVDCNGARYEKSFLKGKHPLNTIEGSMNAKCVPLTSITIASGRTKK